MPCVFLFIAEENMEVYLQIRLTPTIEPELGSSNNSSREQTQTGSQQGEPHSTTPLYPGLGLSQWGSSGLRGDIKNKNIFQ